MFLKTKTKVVIILCCVVTRVFFSFDVLFSLVENDSTFDEKEMVKQTTMKLILLELVAQVFVVFDVERRKRKGKK